MRFKQIDSSDVLNAICNGIEVIAAQVTESPAPFGRGVYDLADCTIGEIHELILHENVIFIVETEEA